MEGWPKSWCESQAGRLLQIVKLSDAVQELPRSVTEFVHGVPDSFLKVGEAKAKAPEGGEPRFSKGAYFIGKVPIRLSPWRPSCSCLCVDTCNSP